MKRPHKEHGADGKSKTAGIDIEQLAGVQRPIPSPDISGHRCAKLYTRSQSQACGLVDLEPFAELRQKTTAKGSTAFKSTRAKIRQIESEFKACPCTAMNRACNSEKRALARYEKVPVTDHDRGADQQK